MRTLRKILVASVGLAAGTAFVISGLAAGPAQAANASADQVAADHTSIYAGKIAELVDAGWAPCAGPVTWSVDPGTLTASELSQETARLRRALQTWSVATGLDFRYVGVEATAVDGPGLQVGPVAGATARSRHIYVAFRGTESVPAFINTVYGYAAPTLADRTTRQITGGFVLIRTDHVREAASADSRSLRSLYVHELGHVLGLGHAQLEQNIMYPIVTDQVQLGAGDAAGVRQLITGCPGQAPA